MRRRAVVLSLGLLGAGASWGHCFGTVVSCKEVTSVTGEVPGKKVLQLQEKTRRTQPVQKSFLRGVLHVVAVVMRAGWFLYFVIAPLGWLFVLNRISSRLVSEATLHDMILEFLQNSGPCFLKLGQWMATRSDLFSKEFCRVVGRLHADAPMHSWHETSQQLREAFGDDYALDEVFESIEEKPLHSGAIAQVHRAVLRDKHLLPEGSGRDVVIKVMHPSVDQSFDIDLTLLKWSVNTICTIVPHAYWVSLLDSFNEFDDLMRSQLDFAEEAEHMTLFKHNFKSFPNVTFPTPVHSLCTRSVLVESFEEGVTIKDYFPDRPNDSNHKFVKRRLGSIGCNAFFKMVFEDNFFHADLHPGNILVKEGPNGKHSLVFLDAGLVSWLSKKDQRNFIELFGAVCAGDGRLAAELIVAGAPVREGPNVERFKAEMERIVDRVNKNLQRSFRLADIQIGEVLMDAMEAVRENRVKLDPNFTTLILSIIVLEGLGRSLWPDMDLFKSSIPYLLPHLELTDVRHLVPIIAAQYGFPLQNAKRLELGFF